MFMSTFSFTVTSLLYLQAQHLSGDQIGHVLLMLNFKVGPGCMNLGRTIYTGVCILYIRVLCPSCKAARQGQHAKDRHAVLLYVL